MTDRAPKLSARWSKRERDLLISYPSKPDGHLLYNMLTMKRCRLDGTQPNGITYDKAFTEELEERGYDITTLKFSIERKRVEDKP